MPMIAEATDLATTEDLKRVLRVIYVWACVAQLEPDLVRVLIESLPGGIEAISSDGGPV
jgi:hypothetical protein